MRIVGGTLKGRRLQVPAGLPVRPTTDFAKEALFNVLQNHIDWEQTRVLDLFCGTGSLSVECCSRGAASVLAIDQNRRCVAFVKSLAKQLDLPNLEVRQADVFSYLPRLGIAFDLTIADPPYAHDHLLRLPNLILEAGLLVKDGFLVLEHPAEHDFSQHPAFFQHRRYGHVNFSFFQDGHVP
jgi:16S rRNA (guanine(966)-N(2))-methyltransferase RsmD